MAIIIKEIQVKTTIEKSNTENQSLTNEIISKLKREILDELIKVSEKRIGRKKIR